MGKLLLHSVSLSLPPSIVCRGVGTERGSFHRSDGWHGNCPYIGKCSSKVPNNNSNNSQRKYELNKKSPDFKYVYCLMGRTGSGGYSHGNIQYFPQFNCSAVQTPGGLLIYFIFYNLNYFGWFYILFEVPIMVIQEQCKTATNNYYEIPHPTIVATSLGGLEI